MQNIEMNSTVPILEIKTCPVKNYKQKKLYEKFQNGLTRKNSYYIGCPKKTCPRFITRPYMRHQISQVVLFNGSNSNLNMVIWLTFAISNRWTNKTAVVACKKKIQVKNLKKAQTGKIKEKVYHIVFEVHNQSPRGIIGKNQKMFF